MENFPTQFPERNGAHVSKLHFVGRTFVLSFLFSLFASSAGWCDPTVPRFAFVANRDDNTVSVYTVDAATGQLRARGYSFAGNAPVAVAVDPSGQFVYTANESSADVSAFKLDPKTGQLISVGAAVPSAVNPSAIVVDPTGKFVYVANRGKNVVTSFKIDSTTGALSANGAPQPTGKRPISLALDPTGKFLYVVNQDSNSISSFSVTSTGTLAPIGPIPANTGKKPISIVVEPSGKFVITANNGRDNARPCAPPSVCELVSVYRIDLTTGALQKNSFVNGPIGEVRMPSAITVDPSGKFAYLTSRNQKTVTIYKIDNTRGILSEVGTRATTGLNPSAIVVDPSGKFAYTADQSSNALSTFGVDSGSGQLAPLPVSATMIARSSPVSIAISKGTAPIAFVPKFAYVGNQLPQGGQVGHRMIGFFKVESSGEITELTGQGSPLPGTSGGRFIEPSRFITIDLYNRFLYIAERQICAYQIEDSNTGILKFIYNRKGVNKHILARILPPEIAEDVPNFCFEHTEGGMLGIVEDPSGRFVYTPDFDNQISGSQIDFNKNVGISKPVFTGTIRNGDVNGGLIPMPGSPFPAGRIATAMVVDPSGRFAYASNGTGPGRVSAYKINPRTGALAELTSLGSPFTAPFSVSFTSLAMDPLGRFIFATIVGAVPATTSRIAVFSINPVNGALTNLLPMSTAFGSVSDARSIAVDPTGRFLYTTSATNGGISGFSIPSRAGSGRLTPVPGSPFAPLNLSDRSKVIAIDPSGRFLYVDTGSPALPIRNSSVSAYSIDPSSGTLQPIKRVRSGGENVSSIAILGVLN
jgi:6-phosphogluconolactonase (cycloisomerase 2 family)